MAEEKKDEALNGDAGAGGDTSDEAAGEKIERLTRELEEKTREAAENYDRYLRERAELENFKKRMQREKAEALKFASEDLIRDLIPLLDNLERAIEHAEAGGNGQPLVEGIKLVFKGALDVLRRYGVSRVEATGEQFDPSLHEAIQQVDAEGFEPNRVVTQFLPGYCLHERLLRPAQVSVARKPQVENADGDD